MFYLLPIILVVFLYVMVYLKKIKESKNLKNIKVLEDICRPIMSTILNADLFSLKYIAWRKCLIIEEGLVIPKSNSLSMESIYLRTDISSKRPYLSSEHSDSRIKLFKL